MRSHSEQLGSGGIALRTHAAKRKLPDLICLSHLRWGFVYQRPQHIMARWAKERRVFFVEEPIFEELHDSEGKRDGYVEFRPQSDCQLVVVVPHLPIGLSAEESERMEKRLVDRLMTGYRITDYLLWYYTPMALPFTRHLHPRGVIYDCMDELSGFAGAPKELCEKEAELFARADIVLTGGYSLYEAKCSRHGNVYPFPSSVDRAHFAQARTPRQDPADQLAIPHPRLGFFGVIDERMDLALLDEVAAARAEWQIVLIGPVVKIAESSLPRRANIHYLGMKPYQELPAYLAGWDVALLPFARNASTRFISPTKTPEYLAAGKPVVSTSIRDVVRPYGQQGLVRIADTAPDFIAAIAQSLAEESAARLPQIDAMLAQTSWDSTWQNMKQAIESTLADRPTPLWSSPCLTI